MLTIKKDEILAALKKGNISCSYTDPKTGERIMFMVANDEEAAENKRIDGLADRLEKGENLTPEFLKEVAETLRDTEKDRTMWRGRMKYVLHKQEEASNVKTTHIYTSYWIVKDGPNGKPIFFGLDDVDGPGCSYTESVWVTHPFSDVIQRRTSYQKARELMDTKSSSGKWLYVFDIDRAANARIVEVTMVMTEIEKEG